MSSPRPIRATPSGRDPWTLEGQAELAAAGLKNKRRGVAALSDRYARALDELRRAEDKLARTLRKWEKARAKCRRLERELARAQAAADAAAAPAGGASS
jgi:hypothetical protein